MSSFVRAGMELAQDADFSATLTKKEFAQNLKRPPTTLQSWAAWQKTLSPEKIKLRQCKLRKLRWLAAASRPDICARSARIASRVNSPQGSDVYRINDLARTVEAWRKASTLKYWDPSDAGKPGKDWRRGRCANALRSSVVSP